MRIRLFARIKPDFGAFGKGCLQNEALNVRRRAIRAERFALRNGLTESFSNAHEHSVYCRPGRANLEIS